jgi:8-oxo-dGTP pyrophosphatase MutT (NUDIX family)
MSLTSRTLTHLSDAFVISCGTITLDLAQAKMLLIRWKKNGEILLPKGRKNIGETLEDAAKREIYEETGVQVTLLPLQIPTLATPGAAAKQSYGFSTEPVALSQRISNGGVLKIIFWFVAQGNSMVAHDVGT